MTRNVGIYIFDEVEVLDFAGPFEVFSVASRVKTQAQPGAAKPFEVITIADRKRLITARGGLMVQPQFGMGDNPAIDVLIVPGGVVSAELGKPEIIRWVSRVAPSTTLTASVCTGAFLLAKAGLLDGKQATTHWMDIDEMRIHFPAVQVESKRRWIDTGHIITSAGISAGIDMSLHLVARLEGGELAEQTARRMEYEWKR